MITDTEDLSLKIIQYAARQEEFTSADLSFALDLTSHTARKLLRHLVAAEHLVILRTENRNIVYGPTDQLREAHNELIRPLSQLRVPNLKGDRISIGTLFRRIREAGPERCVPAIAQTPSAFFQALVDLYQLALAPDSPNSSNPMDVRHDFKVLANQAKNLAAVASIIAEAPFWQDIDKLGEVLIDFEKLAPDEVKSIIKEWVEFVEGGDESDAD